MADSMVADLWILDKYGDDECLSCNAGIGAECVLASECYAYGEYLSARAEEEYGV